MKLNVTNPINWKPEPGTYRGTIEHAGEYKTETQARIIVALDYDDGSGFDYKVHHVYPAKIHPGSDLHRDIESIMGAGYLSRIKEFDLDELVGKNVWVDVIHITSPKHRNPLVTFDAIYPPPQEQIARIHARNTSPPIFDEDEPSGPIEWNLRQLQQQITELDRRAHESS
jgi:hypothetical protein